jgi:hypothetical protein
MKPTGLPKEVDLWMEGKAAFHTKERSPYPKLSTEWKHWRSGWKSAQYADRYKRRRLRRMGDYSAWPPKLYYVVAKINIDCCVLLGRLLLFSHSLETLARGIMHSIQFDLYSSNRWMLWYLEGFFYLIEITRK